MDLTQYDNPETQYDNPEDYPFKVGDRVRIAQEVYAANHPTTHSKGCVGTVVEADWPHGCDVLPDGDENHAPHGLFYFWHEIEAAGE